MTGQKEYIRKNKKLEVVPVNKLIKIKSAAILLCSLLLLAMILPSGCSGTGAAKGDQVYDGVEASSLVAETVSATSLSPGSVPVAGTGGVLSSDSDISFSDDTLTVTNLETTSLCAPTGRAFDYIVAASDSERSEQVDFCCSGLGNTYISDGTGGELFISPKSLTSYLSSVDVTTEGDFDLTLDTGISGTIMRLTLQAGEIYQIPISTVGTFWWKADNTFTATASTVDTTVVAFSPNSLSYTGETITVSGDPGYIQIVTSGTGTGTLVNIVGAMYDTWTSDTSINIPSSGEVLFKMAGGSDDTEIESLLSSAPAGSSFLFKKGHYLLGDEINYPTQKSYRFFGEGMTDITYSLTYTTPESGTCFMGPSSWNSAGVDKSIFKQDSGDDETGKVEFYDMCFMPAWDYAPTSPHSVYQTGITNKYSANFEANNLMLLPWGFLECGKHDPPLYEQESWRLFDIYAYGMGSACTIGDIWLIGQGSISWVNGYDSINIHRCVLYYSRYGLRMGGTWQNEIQTLDMYGVASYGAYFTNSSYNNHIGVISFEHLSVNQGYHYLVRISTDISKFCTVKIDQVYIWHAGGSTSGGHDGDTDIYSITSDDTRLVPPCVVYNLKGTGLVKSAPESKVYTTPFGDTLSAPFLSSTAGIVSGGSANPTSGTTYSVNCPIDVTISGGTVSDITTKDPGGNTIDTGVTSLTHRLLLPYYTIKVTYTLAPTTTVVQATVGDNFRISASLSGSVTATPQAGVNYVAIYKGFYLTISGGTGVEVTTKDGSDNTGGDTMLSAWDSVTYPIPQYNLLAGQILNFGAFSVAPDVVVASE
ncbi:MAG: hypothetical protein JXA46_04665 [Dehalococcoidales bacterium]|nr:hypothetical protein [Dehalococcoidales bacterium]